MLFYGHMIEWNAKHPDNFPIMCPIVKTTNKTMLKMCFKFVIYALNQLTTLLYVYL